MMRGRIAAPTVGVLLTLGASWMVARAQTGATDEISGVVVSRDGPEAGVWVIAETHDLNTTFRKIVVTDDHGRFLLPDLPPASYEVWVRGYGLVDSHPVEATPGAELRLAAAVALDRPTPSGYDPLGLTHGARPLAARQRDLRAGPRA